MIEVPLWIFILICIATYVNVLQYLSLSSKLKRNIKQDNVNGLIVSKGFDEIAQVVKERSSLRQVHICLRCLISRRVQQTPARPRPILDATTSNMVRWFLPVFCWQSAGFFLPRCILWR